MSRTEKGDRTQQTGRLTADELRQVREAVRGRSFSETMSLVLFHRDGVRVVPLAENRRLVVGRAAPADVTIRDPSLSRQHAAFELKGNQIWVEDLGSTNGTWLNGERINRACAQPGARMMLGAVECALRVVSPSEQGQFGLEGHDRFQQVLDAEVSRARTFGRGLALVMVKSCKSHECCVSTWIPKILKALRPFDEVALYSPETLEILMPEVQEAEALGVVQKLGQEEPSLCFGVGVLPTHARSSEELLAVTLQALRQGRNERRIQLAGSADGRLTTQHESHPQELVVGSLQQSVFQMVEKLATSSLPVLVQGETGTGKEIVARALHERSRRRNHPLKCVNCGGIPLQLVESTLFGHEKGSFTGAITQAQGVFEAANHGTVLLDEVGELPLSAQAALLRVLETKRFSRIGSTREIEVDVRVITATHRDLESMCRSGQFREDLFFRLNAATIRLPPLRERPQDVKPLALHFLELAQGNVDKAPRDIDPPALKLMERYPWPGNARELRNAIERAIAIAQGDFITVDDLPERIRALEPASTDQPQPLVPEPAKACTDLRAELDRREAELILQTLQATAWDRNLAAKQLGLPLRTLAHKMQHHGIKKMRYEKEPS